jgi:hypothetical protein
MRNITPIKWKRAVANWAFVVPKLDRKAGTVMVKFWYGSPGLSEWSWGLNWPLKTMLPSCALGGGHGSCWHCRRPMTIPTSVDPMMLFCSEPKWADWWIDHERGCTYGSHNLDGDLLVGWYICPRGGTAYMAALGYTSDDAEKSQEQSVQEFHWWVEYSFLLRKVSVFMSCCASSLRFLSLFGICKLDVIGFTVIELRSIIESVAFAEYNHPQWHVEKSLYLTIDEIEC